MRVGIQQAYPFVDPERIHVVYNGIDTVLYHPDPETNVLTREGVDPDRPYVIFVGRITRQKGVAHLVRAAHAFDPDTQVVLCAGAPDTKEIGAEIAELVRACRPAGGVLWSSRCCRGRGGQLLSHRAGYRRSVGLRAARHRDIEAMACRTPVVASNVGGIRRSSSTARPACWCRTTRRMGGLLGRSRLAVNELVRDAARAREMGEAGRRRAGEDFGWAAMPAPRSTCTNPCSPGIDLGLVSAPAGP